jgi:hypothetical protein
MAILLTVGVPVVSKNKILQLLLLEENAAAERLKARYPLLVNQFINVIYGIPCE